MKQLFKTISLIVLFILIVGCAHKESVVIPANSPVDIANLNTCQNDRNCGSSDLCENNECIPGWKICEEVAELDYLLSDPYCEYLGKQCYCDEIKIITEEVTKIHNDSIEIITPSKTTTKEILFYLKR